jgi:branched-chain amino acid transport system permease protein
MGSSAKSGSRGSDLSLPCGTRNFSYSTDMAIIRTPSQWVLFILFVIALFTMPLYLGQHWLSVANLIGITIIAATGLNILTGYCGQLSVGHAGFIAVGAYTSAVLTGVYHIPFVIAFLIAGMGSGIIGVIFGVSSLRVKGFYLAIATIAAQVIILWVISHLAVTGGFNGMHVQKASIFGFVFDEQNKLFLLIMAVAMTTVYFAKNLLRTRLGRAFIAIRDNDLAAEVMGINLFRYKLLAFFIGCFFAGLAGSLTAHWIGYISVETFPISDSILYIGMIIIGGAGSALGPILGVTFIRLLQQGVTQLSPFIQRTVPDMAAGITAGLGPLMFGLAIVLFLILEPRGLAHRWQLFKSSYRLWPFSY